MAHRARLVSLLLVSALMAACGAQGTPSAAVRAETDVPSGSELPPATANPCTVAVTRLAAFTTQIANNLASLRPLVVATRFDSGETVAANRRVAATLTANLGIEQTLRGCTTTAELAEGVELLRASADATLDNALSARITDAQVQRDAAVSLFGLLPRVLALSEAGKSMADNLGMALQIAQVPDGSTQPIGSLAPIPTPTPTPKPTPPPTALAIKPAFFGSSVSISTYKVSGSTPSAISASIRANGPYSSWLKGNAAGLTKPKVTYRYHYETGLEGCRIVVDKAPAFVIRFTIVLPRWTALEGVSGATVQWWNSDIRDTATHEKVHVTNGRSAVKRLNSALASSTCATASRNLAAVVDDWQRADCEFDMKEYGAASGLSLKFCLAR